MSEENVQLVRQMVEAGNSGDLRAWASVLHTEIEYVPLAENPQTEPLHGVEEVLAFVTDWLEPWDDYTIHPTRIVEGDDWVVVAATHSGRHGSGTEISMEMYTAGRVRDGKFIELRWFMDEADALRAAGLSE
jgi:ketosteroid isomerase-like protein